MQDGLSACLVRCCHEHEKTDKNSVMPVLIIRKYTDGVRYGFRF